MMSFGLKRRQRAMSVSPGNRKRKPTRGLGNWTRTAVEIVVIALIVVTVPIVFRAKIA